MLDDEHFTLLYILYGSKTCLRTAVAEIEEKIKKRRIILNPTISNSHLELKLEMSNLDKILRDNWN